MDGKLTIQDLDVDGKRVLVRVDYNVPLDEKLDVVDGIRIDATIPTIKKLFKRGAHSIHLISHLGRPNGERQKKFSLAPVAEYLSNKLGTPVQFLSDCVGPKVERTLSNPQKGSVFLLENLRFHIAEKGKGKVNGKKVKASKAETKSFRDSLSMLGDVMVFDAFAVAHRAHSSVVGVNLRRAAGLLLEKEIVSFNKALGNPKKPFLAILGGAKVHDKIKLISNLLTKVDEMIIGGGMAFTFLKVIKNLDIGNSLYDKEGAGQVRDIMRKASNLGVKIHLPVDFVIADKFDKDARARTADSVPDGWMGLDCGPKTVKNNSAIINRANTIVWNGPQGVFEFENFSSGTKSAMHDCTRATKRGAMVVIGGGDTASAAKIFGATVSHISTGGGASLELLEGKSLPGIEGITRKARL